MHLKEILVNLFKTDTTDEEEASDKAETDADGVDGGDETQSSVDQDTQDAARPRGLRRISSRIRSFLFPSPSNEEEVQAYIPHYRILPILSGIAIPFCILLEIPGLTADWYIHTEGSTIIDAKPNPPLFDAGIALSILCAVLANASLVVRFLERRIKTMTIFCTVFLSIHDIINVTALAAFGGTKSGYTFGQAFWMTLCSTIVSMFTNVTLIIDLIRTPDFKRSGSGLTRKQRSLVIIIIGLFCYLALGALVNAFLLNLTFLNALYFTVVTIETIGFGDIVPKSRGSRVFICFYATLGIINLAFVVGYVRETVLEGLDFGYRRRLLAIQERRRAVHRRRRAENRWKHAIIWRLRESHTPVWIPEDAGDRKPLWSKLGSTLWHMAWNIRSTAEQGAHRTRRRPGMKLNLWALPPCQLEAAALEAGVPLDTLLPANFYDMYDRENCVHGEGVEVEHHTLPSWFAPHPVYHRDALGTQRLTHRRLGAMSAILTYFGLSVYESGGSPLPAGHDQDPDSFGSLQTTLSEGDYRADVVDTEAKAYYTRSGLSWGWFLIFWMGGAAIFKATEGWTYGLSVYFCFIAFSTIGYGDLAPMTPAGRSIFIVWALVGVATMTIFISVISEAYTSRYKGILGRNPFKHAAQQYRQRTRVELSEKVERIDTSTNVEGVLRETVEREESEVEVEGGLRVATAAAEDEAPAASTSKSDQTDTINQPDGHEHVQRAQRSLEQLPQQILAETRSIQQYVQLIGDGDGRSADMNRFVDETVWDLVDDVMGGRKVTECTKVDILKDGESRQTLMLLGIERSLNVLVNISEEAIGAIQERDRRIAVLEREQEQDDTVSGE